MERALPRRATTGRCRSGKPCDVSSSGCRVMRKAPGNNFLKLFIKGDIVTTSTGILLYSKSFLFQSLMVLSALQLARVCPSGLKARPQIPPECPVSVKWSICLFSGVIHKPKGHLCRFSKFVERYGASWWCRSPTQSF